MDPLKRITNIQESDNVRFKFPYTVIIARSSNGITKSFYHQAQSLDEALFFRNLILDLIGDPHPDHYKYTGHKFVPPNNPHKLPKVQDFVRFCSTR